jgi:hypothetical protein
MVHRKIENVQHSESRLYHLKARNGRKLQANQLHLKVSCDAMYIHKNWHDFTVFTCFRHIANGQVLRKGQEVM